MDGEQKQVLNLQRVQALEMWLKTTSTKLIQVNGQRKYGGPPTVWAGPPPEAHCEVFISQIPRDAYEDLLIPLFSSVGPLWEFRLMMNFSGQNRGFAYAKYGSKDVMMDAIRRLNGYVLEPGYCLNVCRSKEKRHLCIRGLPPTTKHTELHQVLSTMVDDVQQVSLKMGPGIAGVSAIVAFTSHHASSMAKKVLVEAFKKQFALSISIGWHSSEDPGLNKPLVPLNPPTLLPCLLHYPSMPPRFCRAVGGPVIPQQPSSCLELQKVCELAGIGPPLYELRYRHTQPNGFLHFAYKVYIPRLSSFKGLVMILPGHSTSSMLEEARQAAAQQVLQSVSGKQLWC